MRVLVFGTFDVLHPGHRFVIEEALKRGEVTVVVARDTTVRQIKKRSPRQSECERSQVLQEAFPSIIVMLGDSSDYRVPIAAVAPDLILLGYDQSFPPGVSDADFPCPVERLPAFEPEKWKSSKTRG